ncbi:MAG: MFS transporter [Alphaproteobacteria bacterium]|nr:MFS transporter [Alphaproteobacteria bacterium]
MADSSRSNAVTTTPIPWRVQLPVYGAAMFSNSSLHLYNTIVPLWSWTLTKDPLIVGIILGARHILPLMFLIHGGAMMDRFGTRRVMLIFAGAAIVIPMLYPMAPLIPMLILFQMFGGLAVMTTWIGAQSLTGSLMRGRPVYTGRLTLATRIGTIFGPPIVGAIWDFAGAWWAFSFLSLWATLTFISTFFVPAPPKPKAEASKTATTVSDVMPKLNDYLDAFRLVAIPAIGLVFMVTILRHSGVAMQSNFYVIYLNGIGISGTLIGFLFSVLGFVGGVGAISTGWLATKFSNRRILLSSIALGVVMMTITPLIGWTGFTMDVSPVAAIFDFFGIGIDWAPVAGVFGLYLLFVIAMAIRGATSGVAQAMEISMVAQAAGEAQGKGAGLRVTAGRIAAVFLPILMGATAKLFGLEMSFFIIGGAILAVLGYLALRDSGAQEKPNP